MFDISLGSSKKQDVDTNKIYDFLIVGGGPSGYSAAIYSARYGMSTIIVARERGGLITSTHIVENWPGEKAIEGMELMHKIEDHVKDYDVDIVDDTVVEVKKEDNIFIAKTESGKEIRAYTILLATGTKRRELNVQGEKEYMNRGVSYCATCDGPLFRDKIVGVVGGSDSAAKEALFLSEHAKKVYIIYRREKIRAEPINTERVEKNEKIEIINNTNVVEIKGDGNKVTHVIFDREYNGSKEFKIDGLFIEIGHLPQNELAKQLGVKLSEHGSIITDKYSRTNVDGVYAAGDITDMDFKQAITGAAQGTVAAYSAFEYLGKVKKE